MHLPFDLQQGDRTFRLHRRSVLADVLASSSWIYACPRIGLDSYDRVVVQQEESQANQRQDSQTQKGRAMKSNTMPQDLNRTTVAPTICPDPDDIPIHWDDDSLLVLMEEDETGWFVRSKE